ncbi:hypothetical protein HPG69_007638, partial [Diceros bicornis minor]
VFVVLVGLLVQLVPLKDITFWKTGRLVALSEQNLMDCSWAQGNDGSFGGLMDNAFYLIPFTFERKNPANNKPDYSAANDTGFLDIQKEKFLMEAVATVGPVSAGIDASRDTFHFYKDGIYYDPACSREYVNHAILVVGYSSEGKDSNNKYWLVKNRYKTSNVKFIF